MGLSGLFGGKDDPVTAWRKEMAAAVKNGDLEHFKFLLKRDIEAPPAVLDDILSLTVRSNLVKMTAAVLAQGGRRSLDNGVLQRVVYDGQTEMYRLLTDHGWDFARSVPGGDGTQHYLRLERYMAKDYEADRLRAELAAVKKELSELKKTRGIEERPVSATGGIAGDTPPSPKKFTP